MAVWRLVGGYGDLVLLGNKDLVVPSIGARVAGLQGASAEPSVQVVAQGSLLQVRVRGLSGRRGVGALRGPIRGFSKASRLRMLRTVSRLDPSERFAFVTVTQRECLTWDESMRALQAFRKRLQRAYPESGAVWRKGLQVRGAVHFHALIWGAAGLTREQVGEWWRSIVGQEDAVQVDVQHQDGQAAMRYVAKYAGKLEEAPAGGEGDGALDNDAYQAAGAGQSTGRWWGVWGRQYLPWAIQAACRVALRSSAWWWRYKRLARRRWRGARSSPYSGFTLFVGDALSWLRALSWCVSSAGGRMDEQGVLVA